MQRIAILLPICLLITALVSNATVSAAAPPPNLVFIIADDLTFRDLGCYGGQAHTPNIDALATEGMQFTKCFQAAPMCSPTRHNIYTGLYPVHSGAYPNHTFAEDGTKSIAHYLQPLGYRVALSGKTHIGPKETFPFEYSAIQNNPDIKAIEKLFVECQQSETPFCLFACSNEPHTPWNKGDASKYPPSKVVLPTYLADTPVVRENFSRYLAEITYYDSQVGEILSLLDKLHLAENTLVMVVSEQGNSLPFAKWTCYGNGLQSAMIVRWPGHVKPNSTNNALIEYVDIAPTFVEVAGGNIPGNLDGKSLVNVLTGTTNKHKEYVYGIMTTRGINDGSDMYGIRTVRDQRYRLIWNLHHETKFTNACTTSEAFKSMVAAAKAGDAHARQIVDSYQLRPEWELYDCEADPLERNNIYADERNAPIVARLTTELHRWMKAQGDQGHETERTALLRQKRYQSMSLSDAEKVWQKQRKPK